MMPDVHAWRSYRLRKAVFIAKAFTYGLNCEKSAVG
jgi:hypothetical protein